MAEITGLIVIVLYASAYVLVKDWWKNRKHGGD